MRHLTLIGLAVLATGSMALVATSARAHHVGMGNSDYNDIGPCPDDYFYDPDNPELDFTDCWNVHGGVDDDGLYIEPNRGRPEAETTPTEPGSPQAE